MAAIWAFSCSISALVIDEEDRDDCGAGAAAEARLVKPKPAAMATTSNLERMENLRWMDEVTSTAPL